MKTLPIVKLIRNEKEYLYYADERLGEYRSVDGSEPWIIPQEEVAGAMQDIIKYFSVSGRELS